MLPKTRLSRARKNQSCCCHEPALPFRSVHEPGLGMQPSHMFPTFMLSVLANGSPVCVILSSENSDDQLDDDHDQTLTPTGCVCARARLRYIFSSIPKSQAPCTSTLIMRGHRKIPDHSSSANASLLRARNSVQSGCHWESRLVPAPQSSSSLPEATLSSMASRMAFSSNTGPCPSHLARCFSRLLMSAMSTRPLLYRSWLMM